MKEILFNCVTYAATVYHQSEREVPEFVCRKFFYDLVWSIPTWFQVIDQLVINIYPKQG